MTDMKNKIKTASAEGGLFAMVLPVEESGIFKQGWKPDELDAVKVICKRQNDIESGALAAVVLKGDSQALLKRVHKTVNGVVLEAPKNFDKPDEHIPPIVLTAKEAEEGLTVLGKVVQFQFDFK